MENKSQVREIRVTWSTESITTDKPLPPPDEAESLSHRQQVKEGANNTKTASGLEAGVSNPPEHVGQALDHTDKVAIAVKGFLNNWKIVDGRLDLIIRAVDTIAEVRSSPLFRSLFWSRHLPFF